VRPVLPGVDDTHLLEREPWQEPAGDASRPAGSATDR
jgi:hypothetical protein